MASPGPAPPRVRAEHAVKRRTRPDQGAGRGPTRPADERGKGSHPAHRLHRLALVWVHRQQRSPSVRDRPRRAPPPRRARHSPFTFIAPLGLVRPMTRTHVRLLGPCFKTGRVGHRPFARRERGPQGPLCCTTVAGQPGHRRFPPSPAQRPNSGVPVQPGLRRPQQRVAATYITGGNTPAGAGSGAGTPKSAWVASANPTPGRPEPTS